MPILARSFNWFDPKDAELAENTTYDVELTSLKKRETIQNAYQCR